MLTGLPGYGNSPSDEDEEPNTATISDRAELMRRFNLRPDVVAVYHDWTLALLEPICLILAFTTGLWLSTCRFIPATAPDFLDGFGASLSPPPVILQTPIERPPRQSPPSATIARPGNHPGSTVMASPRSRHPAHGATSSGSARSRIYTKGVLGALANAHVIGAHSIGQDGLGGIWSGIDAILQGTHGLVRGNATGPGRRGASVIGTVPGWGNSGPGDGASGGVDNLIEALMLSGDAPLILKKTALPEPAIAIEALRGSQIIKGGRNRSSIARVVLANISSLRYAYQRLLRQKPALRGKVTIKFALDESGNVIFCAVKESTVNDTEFEALVVNTVQQWRFDKIDSPGDVTEVVYPFVFAM